MTSCSMFMKSNQYLFDSSFLRTSCSSTDKITRLCCSPLRGNSSMGLGKRSWEGQKILIFGREPLQPAFLQEQIASSVPFLETEIESFEVYEDALEYCKSERN